MKAFTSEEAKKAFVTAVESVESTSGAELVVAVRPKAQSYLHAFIGTGVLWAVLALAFMLFSPWSFSTSAIFMDPLLVGVLATLLSFKVPIVGRWWTFRRNRVAACRLEAQSTFFHDKIRHTREKIGILVAYYILEKEVIVLCDDGVQLPDGSVELIQEELRETLEETMDGTQCALRLEESFKQILSEYVPRGEDDVNELPDEVRA